MAYSHEVIEITINISNNLQTTPFCKVHSATETYQSITFVASFENICDGYFLLLADYFNNSF
jgi:hypothetical protein